MNVSSWSSSHLFSVCWKKIYVPTQPCFCKWNRIPAHQPLEAIVLVHRRRTEIKGGGGSKRDGIFWGMLTCYRTEKKRRPRNSLREESLRRKSWKRRAMITWGGRYTLTSVGHSSDGDCTVRLEKKATPGVGPNLNYRQKERASKETDRLVINFKTL